MVGKSHLPEFAWNVLGTSDWYGTCHNPVHPGRTTGGSSSGNAAALATDLCDLAIGTDTGCSIRLPAACCDVVGLKPAWGTAPLDGIFPLVPSLDTVGPMARTVDEAAALWSAISETTLPAPRLDGLTIGLLRQPPGIGDGRTTERSDAAEQWAPELERLGAKVVEAALPGASADTWPVFLHEAADSHASTFPSRADEYGAGMRAKLERAALVDPDEVTAGYRALLEWRAFVPEVDLYISPCVGIELPAEEADELEIRLPLSSFLRWVNSSAGQGLRSGTCSSSRRETRLSLRPGWPGSVGKVRARARGLDSDCRHRSRRARGRLWREGRAATLCVGRAARTTLRTGACRHRGTRAAG